MKLLAKTLASVALATAGATVMFTSTAQAASFSSPIYQVNVQSTPAFGSPSGSQYGSWNAITGTAHPTGPGNNILYRDTTTTTNFSSLRIFGSNGNTDYTFGGRGGGINLDPYLTSQGSSAFGSNGFRTNWSLTPQSLNISQDLFVVGGSNYNQSAIYHVVDITNQGNSTINIGWRNLYDWAVNGSTGFDDGPSNQIQQASGSVIVPATTNEFSYTPGSGDYARVNIAPGTAGYQPLLGLGYDPGFVPGLPVTRPDRYDFASWPLSVGTAYDYTINPSRNVTSDSAGLSFFTREIAAGESVRLTQVIFATIPDAPPPGGNPSTSVPEPSTAIAMLTFGAFGVGSLLKRKQQHKTAEKV